MQCISVRTDFFKTYYNVPDNLKNDVTTFCDQLNELGNSVDNAIEFENEFAAQGYQEKFNYLISCCTPKAYKMTAEEKENSKKVAKEIFKEDRSRITKEAVADIADYASVMLNEELITKKREVLIENDLMDDYTRLSNAADYAKDAGNFIKNIFKKKK